MLVLPSRDINREDNSLIDMLRLAFAITGRIFLIASDAVTTLNESSRSSILSSFFVNIGIKANLVLSKTSNASFRGEPISRGITELSIICDAGDSLDNQNLEC